MSAPLDVRAFLRSEGFTVGERGRFSAEMIARVNEKHPGVLNSGGKMPKAPKAVKVEKPTPAPKPAVSQQVAARPTPLLMPKRRPETTGYTTVKGILIRQDRCGACQAQVSRCACGTGPQAHKFLSKEVGSTVLLTLDKPAL